MEDEKLLPPVSSASYSKSYFFPENATKTVFKRTRNGDHPFQEMFRKYVGHAFVEGWEGEDVTSIEYIKTEHLIQARLVIDMILTERAYEEKSSDLARLRS
jgi:hypothetical protein